MATTIANHDGLLNADAIRELKRVFRSDSEAYNALLDAAKRSPYLAGLLNEFGNPDRKVSIFVGKPHNGSSITNERAIVIDPSRLPGSGPNAPSPDDFALTIAHELSHAILPNGLGKAALDSPDDAVMDNRTSEGVAYTGEYIVAKQLHTPIGIFHGDEFHNALDNLVGADNGICSWTLNYQEAKNFTAVTSRAVERAGEIAGKLNPSGIPNLTEDEYALYHYIISYGQFTVDGSVINGNDVDWYLATRANFIWRQNPDGSWACNLINVPLSPRSTQPADTQSPANGSVSEGAANLETSRGPRTLSGVATVNSTLVHTVINRRSGHLGAEYGLQTDGPGVHATPAGSHREQTQPAPAQTGAETIAPTSSNQSEEPTRRPVSDHVSGEGGIQAMLARHNIPEEGGLFHRLAQLPASASPLANFSPEQRQAFLSPFGRHAKAMEALWGSNPPWAQASGEVASENSSHVAAAGYPGPGAGSQLANEIRPRLGSRRIQYRIADLDLHLDTEHGRLATLKLRLGFDRGNNIIFCQNREEVPPSFDQVIAHITW